MMKQRTRLGILVSVLLMLFLQGCSRPQTPSFQAMTLPKTPNYYLVCPQNYCNVTQNEVSPVYPVSAEDLFAAFNQLVAKHRRLNFIYSIPEEGQYVLEYQTLLFNLPEDITVQFIAISDNQSTLAIFSQSRYLPYDFGLNKYRVNMWLRELDQIVKTMPVDNETSSNQQQE